MSHKYTLVPTKTYLKSLSGLDVQTRRRVIKACEKLEGNPYFYGDKLKAVKYGEGKWRLRVGMYRIRYDIDREKGSLT